MQFEEYVELPAVEIQKDHGVVAESERKKVIREQRKQATTSES